jgi:DNA gyrase subunit A
VIMRARIGKETRRGGREQLVVTEIPYATSKTRIIEQIVDLNKKGKVADLSDLRDESDRDGIRIVIELKRGADVHKVVRALLKWTSLQSTFGVISLALDNGVPREFSLKEMLERFRDHRIEVIVRRSQWELGKARDEAHILEGLLIALKNIDEVVRIIRSSRTRESAAEKLRKEFKLSERQAEAILLMRLYRLTQLEGKELRDRLSELQRRIRELEDLLASPQRQLEAIRRELEEIAERYGDARRTQILSSDKKLELEDLIAQEDVVVTLSHEGYIKQIPMYLYRRRMGSGKALAGMDRYENDYLEHVFVASTADTLMFLSDDGQAYWLPVAEIPEAGRTSRGKALNQLLSVAKETRISAMLSPDRLPADAVLVFFTEQGMVKRTGMDQFGSQRATGVNAVNLKKGDRLLDVQVSDGSGDVVLVSRNGRAIRFPEQEVAEMGRAAQGVRGIKLAGADRVVGAVVVRRDAALCAVTEKGFVHRILLADLPVQRRDGQGSVAFGLGAKTGKLVAAKEILPGDELMVVNSSGETSRVVVDEVPLMGRGGPGEPLVVLPSGVSVVEVTRVATRDTDEEESDSAPDAGLEGSLELAAEPEAGTDEEALASSGGEDQYDLIG